MTIIMTMNTTMTLKAAFAFVASLVFFKCTKAQQFTDLPLYNVYPGVSDACTNALNTTVTNCPGFLGVVSVRNPRLNSNQLQTLCTTSCRSSLTSARQTIAQGCTNTSADIIVYDNIAYPATLIIDRFLYTYDLSCRTDKTTNKFCDDIFFSWLNQSILGTSQNCSDCMIGVEQIQLKSPFGYNAQLAQDFQSLTASCAATGYSFASPTAYALNSSATTPTASSTSTAACSSPYTVQAGDSCDSIASARSVSTYAVLSAGGFNPACNNLVSGSSLCLPGQCTLYRVIETDTCASIVSALGNGITGTNLLAWNPNINPLCGNIYSLIDTQICVSPPGGSLGQVAITSDLAISSASTAVAKPTNAPAQSNPRCATWYTVQEGDYCDSVSIHENIALKDFYFLNPEINAQCTNLLLGLAYCIQAVGDISTYSGYPTTSQYYSLTSAKYTSTTATLPPLAAASPTTTPQFSRASGTVSNCDYYINYQDVVGIVDQSQSSDLSVLTANVNNCDYLASEWGVTISNLLSWNPSLSSISPCALQPNSSYCVFQNNASAQPVQQPSAPCVAVDQIYPGTIASCSCFTSISGTEKGYVLCSDIASDSSIRLTDLTTWNPWVGSNCDTGLFANLAVNETRAVCIGVNASVPTASATVGPSGTGKPTAVGTSSSMGPTQTGIITSCTQFYTVLSGDSCAGIDAMFKITFAQFYSWNPAVGSNCQSLLIGYSYCVAAPTSTTVSTVSASATAAPTRSGTPSTCTKYYTVVSGDSCASIDTMFSISFATLYKWNPSIGANCESLWVGYGVCVAGGP